MDELAEKYADRTVSSAFLYTREAHPGENYRHHTSMDDKRSNALVFKEQYQVRRPILLDSIEGDAHRAYGILPNMTWIIGRGGMVHYKAAWTDAGDVETALEYALAIQDRKAKDKLTPFYSESLRWRTRDESAFRTGLERTGPQAVSDFYGEEGSE